MSAKQEALRIDVAGPVTSFRQPHFVQGVQPSYDMPPPATIYGHVCSALGWKPDPHSFRVAFCFSFAARWYDYEHTYMIGGAGPKLSPFERELLYQPRLTLYLDRADWLEDFRRPHYVVTLGRSQDLMVYERVAQVTLQQADKGYIENTLLPLEDAHGIQQHKVVTMPSYLDERRRPQWRQYAQVDMRQTYDQGAWLDTESPTWRGLQRIVHWLSFV